MRYSWFWLVLAAPLFGQPKASILLPERTRLLDDQRVDVVVEVRNAGAVTGFRVTANGADLTSQFRGEGADLDCDGTADAVIRADQMGFRTPGNVRLLVSVNTSAGTVTDVKDILVRPFSLSAQPRNIILFIGDAMATDYRDAGRIVSRSVETVPGVPGLREGFFDRLMEMDRMPVSGMVMNYGWDVLIPDSAATATEWATGNKVPGAGLAAFGDGTDCGNPTAANPRLALDNPRVETLWEYMRRRFGYRTGIVTTSTLADATPAAHGSHSGSRSLAAELTRQFLENPFLGGRPVFDVILGGGANDFLPRNRPDGRDLAAEFEAQGYRLVRSAAELSSVRPGDARLLGLFHPGAMSPAYDKLRLTRPGSEPAGNLGDYSDQPFLDLMTRKAIEALAGPGDRPFLLMVEAGLIDKQSHSNHAAGTIWDVIELDKAVGVARQWIGTRKQQDTLVLVTADHGQTMTVIGVSNVSDRDLYDRAPVQTFTLNPRVGEQKFTTYRDINTNVRAAYTFPPAAHAAGNITGTEGFPDYQDADGDGYPENREADGKGRRRLVVGFRTGSHSGASLPLTAEGAGAFLFTGYMDQTDIFFKMAHVLTGDTAAADALLRALEDPRLPQTPGK
ncbi:MAG: alkaline phosphatase [Bryobacteraceae bacterium]